jgi:hypothetical protein
VSFIIFAHRVIIELTSFFYGRAENGFSVMLTSKLINKFVLHDFESINIPDYLFMQYSLKIRSLDWYNLYWKSDKRITRICEMVQQMINYDTKRKQSNRGCVL